VPQATLEELVELTSNARTGRGLLTRALPLPDGWEQGIGFRPAGCVTPTLIGTCIVSDAPEPDRVADGVVFRPVYVRQTATCTTLSRVGPIDRANERLIGSTEWGLGRVLAEGLSGEPNPSLSEATLVTHASAILPWDAAIDAVACLESAVAETGYGNRAVLHAPYRAAAYLKSSLLMDDNGLSPAGHQWIISAGYPAEPTTVSIWATGPVWAAVSAVQSYGTVNTFINNDDAYSQRLALAAFDPCINFAATFTVPACSGGS
jgi:hypothetical protein